MPEIPLGAIDRIIRKNSSSRVKVETSQMLREILEDVGKEIVLKAALLTKNRNQQIITKDDIELAFNLFKKQP